MNSVNQEQLKSFSRLTLAASVLTFAVIILGSWVRAKDAGLACPDWPLCYNQVVPTFNFQIFLEWFHRLVAGTLTVLLVTISVKLFRSAALRELFAAQISAALILLAVQVVLGGLTVLHLLEPKIVSLHLINAIAFFTVLMGIAYKSWIEVHETTHIKIPAYFKYFAAVTSFFIFIQILLGGMVSSNHAGLACPEFPKCYGQWLPPYAFQIYLQMIHRGFGVLTFGLLLVFAAMTLRFDLPGRIKLLVAALPILFAAQIALGIFNVYFQIPSWSSVLHLATAETLYTGAALLTYNLFYRSESYQTEPAPNPANAAMAVGEVVHARR